ncbi:TetR/AcrR family transcriptional regulator [Corynebacterium nasicanis]|uniref:TetR/AcrR family transcriptional regulator n=1 Tax=Corynebacterium nasicanis TaxID=1448267 RepID=A0ABW1QDE4_9CORY
MNFHAVEFTESTPPRSGPGRPREEGYNELILDAVTRLLNEGKPVTIREVIKATGVSRTAIYRRWKSVNELIAAALDRGRANLIYTFHGPIRDALKEIFFYRVRETVGQTYTNRDFRRHLELMMSNPQLQKVYWESFASRRIARLQAALQQAVRNGEIEADDATIEAAVDAIYGVQLFQYAVRGIPYDSPEAQRRSERGFDIIWRGLRKDGA